MKIKHVDISSVGNDRSLHIRSTNEQRGNPHLHTLSVQIMQTLRYRHNASVEGLVGPFPLETWFGHSRMTMSIDKWAHCLNNPLVTVPCVISLLSVLSAQLVRLALVNVWSCRILTKSNPYVHQIKEWQRTNKRRFWTKNQKAKWVSLKRLATSPKSTPCNQCIFSKCLI